MINSAAPGGDGSAFGNVIYSGQGQAGNAFVFDGQSAAIQLPPMWQISARSQVTLGAWISLGGGPTNVQRWIVGAAGRAQLHVTSNNQVAMSFFGVDNQFHELSDSLTLSSVTYYHYAGVLFASGGSTTLTLYRNGQQVQQTTFATAPAADNGCHLWIGGVNESGACAYTGQFFSGLIDEVRVYGRALSPAEIQTLYNADLAGVPAPLRSYRGEVTPVDERGNPPATLTGKGTYTTGEFGQAFAFDGQSAVDLPPVSITQPISISAWVNPSAPAPSTSWGVIAGRYDRIRLQLVGNQVTLNRATSGVDLESTMDPTPVPMGQWTHYVGVVAQSAADPKVVNTYLYRNGTLAASNASSRPTQPDYGCDWSIGGENEPPHGSCSANAGNFFTGAIDEVKIFDSPLSAGHVSALYTWEYNAARAQTSPNPSDPLLLAQKFAPRLRFDDEQVGYPMSAQAYFAQVAVSPPQGTPKPTTQAKTQNIDYGRTMPAGQSPTYYAVSQCGNQTRINYWTFYGYQDYCSFSGITTSGGSHNGDWENVIVTLNEDQSQVAAVTYSFHGDWYTRYPAQSGVYFENTVRLPGTFGTPTGAAFGSTVGSGAPNAHPVTYSSEVTHSNRYAETATGLFFNYSSSCLPNEESAYNKASGAYMDSWRNLVSLVPPDGEPWMAWDSSPGPGNWGFPTPGGTPNSVSTHPTVSQAPAYRADGNGVCQMQACSYTTIDSSIGKALFSRAEEQSQCLGSDRNTTVGGADPFIPSISISTSCAASKGGTYGIDYKLPATDFGMGLTPSSTTCQPLPASFTATIQNASRNGFLNECLLFGNNGADTSPTRMLWGSGNNGYCGFGLGQGTQDSPEHALEVNGQAVWNFSSQGGGVYVITGYGGRTLADGELAWTLNCVGNNQYTILNQFTNQCLIFTNNGAAPKPTQFNWGNGGSAAYCGLQSASSILANRQAAFTIDVQRVLR